MAKKAAAGLGDTVAREISRQHSELMKRNWPEIQPLLEDDDSGNEVKLAFSTTLTNRPAQEGNEASKDSRIITTLAFSLGKKSDKIESAFPDPNQPELPGHESE